MQTYAEHKEILAKRMRGEAAELPERALRPKQTDERLIQCVWFDRMLADDCLRTVSGKTLRVVDPGRWNHESGPDFLGASLLLDGKPLKGDVEIHVDARDWKRHEHHRDFEYNRVLLHAALDARDGAAFDTKHNGENVERLVMREFIRPDLDTIRRSLNVEDFPYDEGSGRGRCAQIVSEMSDQFLERYFDLAARERMENKIRRFEDQTRGESLDQVFYQGLMTAMGHKGGKALFFLLSKRAPLDELSDFTKDVDVVNRALRLESILLHVANLVPAEADREALDDETRQYLERLKRHWDEVSPYFSDRVIPPTRRWHTGIRPVNFPARRLAGVARLVAASATPQRLFTDMADLFQRAAPRSPTLKTARKLVNDFARILSVESRDYWAFRYSFTSEKAQRAMNLIGASRAQSVLLNAFLPMVILKARTNGAPAARPDASGAEGAADLEQLAWALYHKFPKLQENSVTKFMRQRLFGDDPRAKDLLTTEARQQALFFLFQDCCNNTGTTCDRCSYLRTE